MSFSICVHSTVHFGQGFKGLPAGSAVVMVKQAQRKGDGMFKWV